MALSDMVFSFSRIDSYKTCPKMFYLQYIDCKPSKENAFAQFGTLCHEIFEKYAKGQLQVYELLDEYKNKFNEVVSESFPPNKYIDLREKYYNQGHDYFENFNGLDDYKILGIEHNVKFIVEDKYRLRGIIDLVIQDENGNLIILDYKSKTIFKKKYICKICGKKFSEEAASKRDFICIKKCKGDLEEDKEEAKEYLRQLYLYSIPIFEKYKKYPHKLIFNFFRVNEMYEIDFDIKELEEAKTWVVDTIKKIQNDEVFAPMKKGFFCDYICSVRYDCPNSNRYLGVDTY